MWVSWRLMDMHTLARQSKGPACATTPEALSEGFDSQHAEQGGGRAVCTDRHCSTARKARTMAGHEFCKPF